MFDKIHAKRLTQLADHLEKGELGHKRFDFSIVTDSEGDACGSAGCAIGELPIVFPDHFEFGVEVVRLRDKRAFTPDPLMDISYASACAFFGIGFEEACFLFSPGGSTERKNGLKSNATPRRVAAHIRAFLEYKAKEAEGEEVVEGRR